jgi:glycosyltransferase involved in cell wall biosynthesis
MIVGIDYTAAVWQGAGIGRYTRELVRAAVAHGGDWHYVLFYAARGLPPDSPYVAALRELCRTAPHVRAVPIPLSPRLLTILWQRMRLPLLADYFTGPLDVLHAPDFALPPTRARTLLTVHDLTFLVYPQGFKPATRRYLQRMVPRSLRRADLVLADSEATRADVQRLLGCPAERVTVIYPGVDARFCPLPASASEPVRARLGLPAEFLLFVSTLEPRKNLVRLLEAFHHYLDRHPASTTRLVIAGRKGWLYEQIFAAVEHWQLTARVQFLDFVADADLPALYNLASVFVYPSLYEGFGLPVAEALACGTPVVTTHAASLPEVAGDAAVLVDAHDSQSIAQGIAQAQAQAERLRAAGPVHAQRFRWEQAAEELLRCYQSVGSVGSIGER